MALKVLSALDTARTQYYHFKAIIIAGMGIFTDAYDLFCITPIIKLIEGIDYEGKAIPISVEIPILTVALLGTMIGQVVFGRMGDRMGRRHVYGLALMIMVLSSIGCGFSICRERSCVLLSLGFFRFLLGIGIGGDYPLSATIMSEFANKRTRGAFIAAVFSLQGFGILTGSAVTIVICKIFMKISNNATAVQTPKQADIAWRIILMLGAIPAALTFYWRMMMPETARYTALVEQNVEQAARDMEKVLEVPMSQISEERSWPLNPPPYNLLSKQFLRRHGRDLFSCAISWFLVDIVFYTSNLFQFRILHRYFYHKNQTQKTIYQKAVEVAEIHAIIAACFTIPGYFFTVYLIDRIGRKRIQLIGFLFMSIFYFVSGIPYHYYWGKHTNKGFPIIYGVTCFFANFGPNTTTFIVPAELFPARFRSTCHGIAGAIGKLGAIIGVVAFFLMSPHVDVDVDDTVMMTSWLLILGGVCVLGVLVTYFFSRETMGKSLEDNERDDEEIDHDNGLHLPHYFKRFATSLRPY